MSGKRETLLKQTWPSLDRGNTSTGSPMNDAAPKNDQTNIRFPKHEKIARLVDLMRLLAEEKFTGYIKVNFSQGGIGRIEKFEEILK